MVKASALYIVVIVSLVIAVISASLLTIAYYYKLEVQKKNRLDKLLTNLESGTTILLSTGFDQYDKEVVLDLYDEQSDSIELNKTRWGVFDLHSVKAFQLQDTLKKCFFSGIVFTDQNALYLADEDRPLSVSGTTKITGNGQIPKAGLKQAYVDGTPYAGKELIYGTTTDSERELPGLNEELLKKILDRLDNPEEGLPFNVKDSVLQSFFSKEMVYRLSPSEQNIDHIKLNGKIILVSDTVITIGADAVLQDVQIYAPTIVVTSGFKGSCQLFARDSIIIGKNCTFQYPSFAGVFKPDEGKIQAKVALAEGCSFAGVLMSYEKKRSDLQTMVALSKDCMVNGEVYACGYIKLERGVTVQGKLSARRFIMQTPSTLYENYLIDLSLNRKLLNKYYLSLPIFNADKAEQKILKWLN